MQYFAAVAAASALFTTALAAPTTPGPVFLIKDFTVRKSNGKDVSNVAFHILATNGGTLDFQCIPYDPPTNAATKNFVPGQVYFCGKDSSFSFSYTPKHDDQKENELWLWQTITQDQVYTGHVDVNPICRAGGMGLDDLICSVPEITNVCVAMQKTS